MNQGWIAECHACPTTIGEYGERLKVRQEFPDDDQAGAELWAMLHTELHRQHRVTVSHFAHLQFDRVNINPDVMKRIFSK